LSGDAWTRGRRCGGRRLDCGDEGLGGARSAGRTNVGRVHWGGIGVRSGGFVGEGGGFALGDKGWIEERANLVECDAERGVFEKSGANDFVVGSGEFGKYESAGGTLLR